MKIITLIVFKEIIKFFSIIGDGPFNYNFIYSNAILRNVENLYYIHIYIFSCGYFQ